MAHSKAEDFQRVVSQVREFLETSGIPAITEGNVAATGVEVPVPVIQVMARSARASYLLYVVVDRPGTRPLKVTVQCYDVAGPVIWREQAAELKPWTMSASIERTLQKLDEELKARLGQPGLEPVTAAPEPSQPASEGKQEESVGIVRLASGTPVRLVLLETVSSRTARAGSAVRLQVLGDVKVDGLVVIANRAPASATISTARAAGRAWHAGNLTVTLDTVTLVNQRQQPLLGFTGAGGPPTDAATAWGRAIMESHLLAVFALPLAPLQHGNQADLYKGTVLDARIDGDALLPRAVIEAAQPAPAEAPHGPSSVTFYYPDFAYVGVRSIWCGKTKLGDLKEGGRFTLTLPPGKYLLGTRKNDLTTSLDLKEGTEAYVRAVTFGGSDRLLVVPHDVGEIESAGTVEAKSRSVTDVGKLDISKLQADPRPKK